MIKNIVFDVGKVLIDWNPYETMKELNFSEEAMKAIKEKIFDSTEWSEEDKGNKTPQEMEDYFAALLPDYEEEIRLFYRHATDSIRPRAYVKPLLKSLRAAGYKTYVLSNFGREAMHRGVEMGGINFLDDLDGYLFSYEIHEVKPDLAIYTALFNRYNLIASESVFIDDMPANIEGAYAAGMQGIVFRSYEQLLEELKKFDVIF